MELKEKRRRKEAKKEYLANDPTYLALKRIGGNKFTTAQEILESNDPEWQVVQVVLNRIGGKPENEETILNTLPDGPKFLFATWLLEADVSNGGFDQFFFNQSPLIGELAGRGYDFFGAPHCSAAVAEALHKRNNGATNFAPQDDVILDMLNELRHFKEAAIKWNPEKFVIE